jgi:2-methylcitrate dehydratase PrpD
MPSGALSDMARWASGFRLNDVPERVREHAKNQVLSILAGLHAGYASDLGPRIAKAFPPPGRGPATVIPAGGTAQPAHAALLASAWSMVLDYDDSMLGGHTGHSSVLVPLAYASGHTGEELLAAQIAANELAARINTAVALGPLRGQMATHVHLIGAAAARARLERLNPDAFAQAVGFALTYPAKALYAGFLGSDAKVVAAAWPVRQGCEAVDAVRAGLVGNPATLEAFIKQFADFAVPAFLGGLGERWHTETNSFKIYPGCAYLDAVIDATLGIVRRYEVRAEHVAAVDVHASIFTVGMDVRSGPWLRGPASLVSTLSFSTPYTVACAIRDRNVTPDHLTRPRIEDADLWALADRVRVHHDPDLTIQALTSDAPVGAALKAAGRDALRYVLRMGGSAPRSLEGLRQGARIVKAVRDASTGRVGDLQHARKAVGARVELRTTDGRYYTERVDVPIGAAGWGDHKQVRELMREKYLACAAPVVGDVRAATASEGIERLEELDAEGVAALVAANVRPRKRATSPKAAPSKGARPKS